MIKCPKCLRESNHVTAHRISGNTISVTCRLCRRTSLVSEEFFNIECLGITPMHPITNEPCSVKESMYAPEVIPAPSVESVAPDPVPEVPSEEIASQSDVTETLPVEEPTQLDGHTSEKCPKCESTSVTVTTATAKLGYIKCADCGYDSEAVGKRHRIGD